MSRKLAKFFGVLLTVIALAVTQIPVSDVEAVVTASDFQMEGTQLLKYTGTAEVVSIPDGIKGKFSENTWAMSNSFCSHP